MRIDKEEAFALRRSGKSYNEIARTLGMSVSTLSVWFKETDFSEDIRKNLTDKNIEIGSMRIRALNKRRGDTLVALYEQAEIEAEKELQAYINDPLFVTVVAAYWGEGDKATKAQVRLINTDPMMLKLFLIFLLKVCHADVDKISLALFLYEDLDESQCKEYWSKQVGINKFHKSQFLPSRHKTKRLTYGTCSVVLTSTYLKCKILFWIDQLPKIVLNTVSK